MFHFLLLFYLIDCFFFRFSSFQDWSLLDLCCSSLAYRLILVSFSNTHLNTKLFPVSFYVVPLFPRLFCRHPSPSIAYLQPHPPPPQTESLHPWEHNTIPISLAAVCELVQWTILTPIYCIYMLNLAIHKNPAKIKFREKDKTLSHWWSSYCITGMQISDVTGGFGTHNWYYPDFHILFLTILTFLFLHNINKLSLGNRSVLKAL